MLTHRWRQARGQKEITVFLKTIKNMRYFTLILSKAKKLIFREQSSHDFYAFLCYTIICFGIVLRLVQYLYNRSLWLDEAMLALNIVNRSFTELLTPLDYRQNAPLLFLMLERLSVKILGNSEYALRLPSLIFGIASILLFYQVLKRYTHPNVVLFSLCFFAISDPLIYYSSEVKQYSCDLAASLLIYLIVHHFQTNEISWSKTINLGIISTLLMWISFTSLFVLASGFICLAIFNIKQQNWQKLSKLIPPLLIGLISLGCLYYFFLSKSMSNDALQKSWEWKGGFAPIPILSPIRETIKWYLDTFIDMFISPSGFQLPGLAGMLFLVGCFCLFIKNKHKLLLFLLPSGLTLFASSMQKYPFSTLTNYNYGQGGRLILFLVPSIIILVAEGINYFRNKSHNIVVLIMVGLLFINPMITAIDSINSPRLVEEIRPVVDYVLKNKQPFDRLYLYYRTKHQFDYYQDVLNYPRPNYIVRASRGKEKQYIDDIDKFKGYDRVWFIFSYTLDVNHAEKSFFIKQLNIKGKQIDSIEKYGASAYLYNLR